MNSEYTRIYRECVVAVLPIVGLMSKRGATKYFFLVLVRALDFMTYRRETADTLTYMADQLRVEVKYA